MTKRLGCTISAMLLALAVSDANALAFRVQNAAFEDLAVFNDNGNVTFGSQNVGVRCVEQNANFFFQFPSIEEFVIKDDLGNIVSLIRENAAGEVEVKLAGTIQQNLATLSPPTTPNFVIKDNAGNIVTFIDNNGNLRTTGSVSITGDPSCGFPITENDVNFVETVTVTVHSIDPFFGNTLVGNPKFSDVTLAPNGAPIPGGALQTTVTRGTIVTVGLTQIIGGTPTPELAWAAPGDFETGQLRFEQWLTTDRPDRWGLAPGPTGPLISGRPIFQFNAIEDVEIFPNIRGPEIVTIDGAGTITPAGTGVPSSTGSVDPFEVTPSISTIKSTGSNFRKWYVTGAGIFWMDYRTGDDANPDHVLPVGVPGSEIRAGTTTTRTIKVDSSGTNPAADDPRLARVNFTPNPLTFDLNGDLAVPPDITRGRVFVSTIDSQIQGTGAQVFLPPPSGTLKMGAADPRFWRTLAFESDTRIGFSLSFFRWAHFTSDGTLVQSKVVRHTGVGTNRFNKQISLDDVLQIETAFRVDWFVDVGSVGPGYIEIDKSRFGDGSGVAVETEDGALYVRYEYQRRGNRWNGNPGSTNGKQIIKVYLEPSDDAKATDLLVFDAGFPNDPPIRSIPMPESFFGGAPQLVDDVVIDRDLVIVGVFDKF